MKSYTIVSGCSVLACLCAGGCASTPHETRVFVMPSSNSIALTTLEPMQHGDAAQPTRTYQLGAGDALGQAIYANYAVLARANAGWQYASGETTD